MSQDLQPILVPLSGYLWPKDLRDVSIAAHGLVGLSVGLLQVARLPEQALDRDFQLTDHGMSLISEESKVAEKTRPLLAELQQASKRSRTTLPQQWEICAQSAVELSLEIANHIIAMYLIPRSGPADAPAYRDSWMCGRGMHGPNVDECRRRLQTVTPFDAEELHRLIDREFGLAARIRIGAAEQILDASCRQDSVTNDPKELFKHSPDFVSVVWNRQPYIFNRGQQAACIRLLWKAWESGTPVLAEKEIGVEIDAQNNNFQLAKVFRNKKASRGYEPHPAWGTMIQKVGKGTFQLVP